MLNSPNFKISFSNRMGLAVRRASYSLVELSIAIYLIDNNYESALNRIPDLIENYVDLKILELNQDE